MELLKNIFDDCNLNVQRYGRVHGGDINDTYCLYTPDGKFFLKVNNKNKYPGMFENELRGLDLLRKNSSLITPSVIRSGTVDSNQYLLLEWLEKGSPQKDFWEKFGEALAMMHRLPQARFGLYDDNYIGSLKQINAQHSDWPSFYADCRILPSIKRLLDDAVISSKDADMAGSVCNKLENIFPKEPASLLHGDLWAGNYLIHSSGGVAVYDPAVYCGHREMDIGMTRLFGGFDQRFYSTYNTTYPLEKNWQQRLPLTQLYPILVHAILFGGHYCFQAVDILKRFS